MLRLQVLNPCFKKLFTLGKPSPKQGCFQCTSEWPRSQGPSCLGHGTLEAAWDALTFFFLSGQKTKALMFCALLFSPKLDLAALSLSNNAR